MITRAKNGINYPVFELKENGGLNVKVHNTTKINESI